MAEFISNYPTKKAGAVASWLVLSTPDLGSSSGWVHSLVFLGKTLDSHSASLNQMYMCTKKVPANLMLGVAP